MFSWVCTSSKCFAFIPYSWRTFWLIIKSLAHFFISWTSLTYCKIFCEKIKQKSLIPPHVLFCPAALKCLSLPLRTNSFTRKCLRLIIWAKYNLGLGILKCRFKLSINSRGNINVLYIWIYFSVLLFWFSSSAIHLWISFACHLYLFFSFSEMNILFYHMY